MSGVFPVYSQVDDSLERLAELRKALELMAAAYDSARVKLKAARGKG